MPSDTVSARKTQTSRRTWQRLLLIQLGAVSAIFVAACLIVEFALSRLLPGPDTPGLFVELPESPYEFRGRAGARGQLAGRQVEFNSLGLRDYEFSIAPEPEVARVLVLGDSITFGLGVALDEAYPKLIERALNRSLPKHYRRVDVLNLGMPGYNTLHELAQLREVGLRLEPDVVVVGFLNNDLEFSRRQWEAHFGNSIPLRGPASWLSDQITALKRESRLFAYLSPRIGLVARKLGIHGLGQTGTANEKFVDSNPQWRKVRNALLEMRALGKQHQFELIVMIIPAMASFAPGEYPILEYHNVVAAFCRAHGIRHLDLLPAFAGRNGMDMWINLIDGHPNAQAHRIMAAPLKAVVNDALAERALSLKRFISVAPTGR